MQRELKFRAWDKIEKRMLYRDIFDRNWYLTPKNDANGCSCVRGITPDDKPRIELMQFTGLKDKNGVEIYEGDIVICAEFTRAVKGEVIYKDSAFVIKVIGSHNANLYGGISCEVISNIYEHPELLEAK